MAITYSCLLIGVDVQFIEIETVVGSGFTGLSILGLPTEATRDMRERVRSALESVGISIPARRVVVNLAPSDVIKLSRTSYSLLDFAVAASIVRALFEEKEEKYPLFNPGKEFLAGELSLSGELKPIINHLIYEAILTQTHPPRSICLPYCESCINPYFEYYKNIKEWFENRRTNRSQQREIPQSQNANNFVTFQCNSSQNIKNNPSVNEVAFANKVQDTIAILLKNPKICVALLVAAAGNHHILVAGSPGVGKSFSCKKLPHLLIPLSEKQRIEVKLINSGADDVQKPFRSPHHSCTSAALIGGASLKPGEVTLAHHGILFLDELAEFPRASLEALREPLDCGSIALSRSGGSISYPAKFQLCATANPCPCGYLFSRKKPCRCNISESRKYLKKISGPLLDRFCLQIWLEPQFEQESKDIFSEYILKISNINLLQDFTKNFLKVQKELSSGTRNKESIQPEFTQSLTFRSKERIEEITNTFKLLFPSLAKNNFFEEHILQYRVLGNLFGKKGFF